GRPPPGSGAGRASCSIGSSDRSIETINWTYQPGMARVRPSAAGAGRKHSAKKETKSVFENREGQRGPKGTFKTREGGDWKDITTDELFGGRTVVLFALPGAFTPTCSSSHLPRYDELCSTFREAGIDEVVCLSVNDGFVMDAWGRDQGVKNVRLIADGNGDFSRGMGMLVDKRDLGFGPRSWRYSMLVKNGVIQKMFIEPDKPGDPYEVS